MPSRPSPPRTVTIVSANRETLDELKAYLERAGLRARALPRMAVRSLEHPQRSVLVVFPDEFSIDEVLVEIACVGREHPHVLSLIVTRQPLRFGTVASETVTVLPKPAWGWTILEAIQAREI